MELPGHDGGSDSVEHEYFDGGTRQEPSGAEAGERGSAGSSLSGARDAGAEGDERRGELKPAGEPPPAEWLPKVSEPCPALSEGVATFAGARVRLWIGKRPGPLYFYWHASGTAATEVNKALPGAAGMVASEGGIVAAFETSSRKGTTTGNGVWFTGDFEAADEIVACGVERGLVDPSRIYTAGDSAGGLQACAMITQRSRYLAAGICYSGGAATVSGSPDDASHLPPTLLAHGAKGRDVLLLDFSTASQQWEQAYTRAGGFAIDCDDGGDHMTSAATRLGLDGRAMQFLRDHVYRKKGTDPYAKGLPPGWPSYCTIVR